MPDALGDAMRLRHPGLRQQAAELLAADAEQEIGRSDVVMNDLDEPDQNVVAARVAEAIVQLVD